eukprot:TRINITY_DN3853_c0_g1_i1.p1 TRINITY_DN3853_c0_g1~~TRINITY_DN3853_c0_g1_i1.p1  ORF type:complete len:124 (+),score=18.35 TRINITY_DN3853_c0_g1_i1:79-450(+)
MKLITHNMLQSNVKGVKNGYPLGIRATKLVIVDVPCNLEYVKNILSRIDYAVLRLAARALGYDELPEEIPKEAQSNEDFFNRVHHALYNIEVEEGVLVCQESGREFNIKNGIPDMLLKENEVK